MIIRIPKLLVYHLIALAVFLIAALYITYPLVLNIDRSVTGYGDELVIAWIMNWVSHSLLSGNIFSLFDANTYYPFLHSFAYSDLLITSSLLALPSLLIFREPIVVVNITLISSFIFLGLSLYFLSYYLTRNFFVSIISGILVIFSSAVLDKVMHLQILAIYWVPLSILSFLHFLKTRHTRFLLLTLLCFVLQTYNSFLPGYFIVFSLIIISLFAVIHERKKMFRLITTKNFLAVIISILLLLPVVIPYYQVSKEFNYVRDIRETIHFAIQPEDLLYPSDYTRLASSLKSLPFNKSSQNDEFKSGYLGFVFTILVVISFIFAVRWFKKKDIIRNALFTTASFGLVLSLGPVLHLGRQTIHDPFPIPLPYLFFYYVAPGFQGFRNSARWEMLFILLAAILIAVVLHSLLKHVSQKKRILLYTVLVIGIVAEFTYPMKFSPVVSRDNFPAEQKWIATTPKETIYIELPIYNWNMWPYTQEELFRQYYSTTHFRKMVNGYSGFSPPPWQSLVEETLIQFPNKKNILELKKRGVQYVIIHTDEYDRLSRSPFTLQKQKISSGSAILKKVDTQLLKLERQFNDTYIYKIK